MIIAALVLIIICCMVWEQLSKRALRDALSMRLDFSGTEVCAGEETGFTECVENRGAFPAPLLEIGFRVEKGLSFPDAENFAESDFVYKRDVFSLLGHERIVRKYRVRCLRRGHYTLSKAQIRFLTLPFRTTLVKEAETGGDLYVYARRTDVRDILLQLEALLGENASARRLFEDPFSFAQIRDYTTRDPMKTINWKASARSGALKVNTYTSVQSEQVIVYLDPSDTKIRKEPELVEECISVAAGICRALLSKGLECTLVIGDDVLGPGRGSAFGCGIERSLTGDFSDVPFRLPALRPEAELSGDKIPVWITKNARQEDIRKLSAALEGRPALVVSVESGDVPGPVSEGNIRVLRREV